MKLIMKIRVHQMEPESDSDSDGEELTGLISSFEQAIEGMKPIIDTVDASIQAIGQKLVARGTEVADTPLHPDLALRYPMCHTVKGLIDAVFKNALRLDLASRQVYPSVQDSVALFQGRQKVSVFEVIRSCMRK
jgi:hypothetical protein